jgi:arylsulfatase A-like enzyme
LLFDDLRHDAFSFLGSPARTPHIDALQRESTVFSRACTTTGLCSPSRAALLTGRWGHRTGLDDNCHVWHSRLVEMDSDQTTLLEWARDRGYFVGYFGKWHLGPDGPIRRGAHRHSARGFERWGARPMKTPDFGRIKRYYERDTGFAQKPEYYGTREGSYEDTPARKTVEEGIDFLREAARDERPFFLTVSFNAPHPPYVVPRPYDTLYDPQEVTLPASLNESAAEKPKYQRDVLWPWHDVGHMSDADWRRLRAHYYGFVTLVDRAVGEVLEALDSHGLSNTTLVALAGDQGSMLGEHTLYDKGPYCYDELMRIPLLIRPPGIPGREVKRHVSLLDVNQTLVEWMGLRPTTPNADSRSLLPLMKRGDGAWSDADEVFYRYEWYNGSWYGIRAIRTPRHKYCWNPVGMDELYDLQEDPHEKNNLVNRPSHEAARRTLQKRLLNHLRETHDPAHERLETEIGLAISRPIDP